MTASSVLHERHPGLQAFLLLKVNGLMPDTFNESELRALVREHSPEVTDEEFQEAWEGFVAYVRGVVN